ncbi:MAG: DNA mismatch repair endonuclease MutL, partial [Clostridia bacterium]|nr:DNA mismatch repair endonuclease MutL [Clostridia bacterium]
MSKIRVLTPDVYNKISAGEVIENPVGVVKELVENSIDAGATNIVIEVVEGGFSSISVTDNGCGIEHEDIDRAFVEHATSKVDSLDDLYYLQTLGFRGEALASIAAVSKVQLTTRTSENEVAICVDVENGQVVDRKYVSANLGTKIVVHDLFYNTPARKKFLKTPSREGTEISKFVAKLILTNPKLNISYYLDGQLVYKNGGKGLEEAVFAIYGAEVLEKCLEVNERWELMTIRGYVGNTTFTKPNKNWQTLSVNGRCITDTKINASIMQAYKGYLMTRQYPFFVLDLQIPGDRVDVNVHPKKSEVRFMQHDKVAAFFYNAVTKVLVKYIEMTRNDPFSMFSYEVPAEAEPIGKVPDNFDLDAYLESKGIQLMNPHQAEDVLDIEQATE